MQESNLSTLGRSYYLSLPAGPPLQGDIWTNLPMPHMNPSFGPGILITPSCDFVHDKTPVVNYLSLTRVQEYMVTVGSFHLIEQELHNVEETLRRQPVDNHAAALLEMGVPPSRVLVELESNLPEPQGAALRRLEQFRAHVEKANELCGFLERDSVSSNDLRKLVPEKQIRGYKEKIVKNQIADLHFLPPCPPLLPNPSILLLRCVFTCNIELIRLADSCITDAVWRRECERRQEVFQELRDYPPRPERILRLRSPHLESLMARIGALFGRVGVPDLPRSAVQAFVREEN